METVCDRSRDLARADAWPVLSVSANQKIRENSGPLSSLLPIDLPCAACEEMRFACQSLDTNVVAFEERIAVPLGLEMNSKFRIHDVADHE